MKCTALCMCAALLPVGFLQAGTQQIEAPQEGSVISFHLENDMFVGDDDNYTNGVRFAWMSGTRPEAIRFPAYWEQCWAARTPRIPGGGSWA